MDQSIADSRFFLFRISGILFSKNIAILLVFKYLTKSLGSQKKTVLFEKLRKNDFVKEILINFR